MTVLIACHHKEITDNFSWKVVLVDNNPDIASILGMKRSRKIMLTELLQRGFECYWKRDLHAARVIFRKVIRQGYGSFQDWKYMLPSLLPYFLHVFLLSQRD